MQADIFIQEKNMKGQPRSLNTNAINDMIGYPSDSARDPDPDHLVAPSLASTSSSASRAASHPLRDHIVGGDSDLMPNLSVHPAVSPVIQRLQEEEKALPEARNLRR